MSARTKVYVGNLAYETSWQGLKDHFRQAGEVLHADVLHEPSGRSKGCGLVSFASAAEAAHAIATLSETELDGRAIFVREDREDAPPRSAVGGRGLGGRGGGPLYQRGVGGGECRVHVANLPWEATWQQLKDHFRQAGGVTHVDVATDNSTGRSRGFGTVTFATSRDAAKAIQLFNETEYGGRVIEVRPDQLQR